MLEIMKRHLQYTLQIFFFDKPNQTFHLFDHLKINRNLEYSNQSPGNGITL